MTFRKLFRNLVNLAIIGGCAYLMWNWQATGGTKGDAESFAKSACVAGTESRYRVSNTRAYETARNSSGYVVRLSTTLARGAPAKVTCLTNEHGGVTDIMIDER